MSEQNIDDVLNFSISNYSQYANKNKFIYIYMSLRVTMSKHFIFSDTAEFLNQTSPPVFVHLQFYIKSKHPVRGHLRLTSILRYEMLICRTQETSGRGFLPNTECKIITSDILHFLISAHI